MHRTRALFHYHTPVQSYLKHLLHGHHTRVLLYAVVEILKNSSKFSTENKFSMVPVDVYKLLNYADKNPQCPR
jgi:hypothetical protein